MRYLFCVCSNVMCTLVLSQGFHTCCKLRASCHRTDAVCFSVHVLFSLFHRTVQQLVVMFRVKCLQIGITYCFHQPKLLKALAFNSFHRATSLHRCTVVAGVMSFHSWLFLFEGQQLVRDSSKNVALWFFRSTLWFITYSHLASRWLSLSFLWKREMVGV